MDAMDQNAEDIGRFSIEVAWIAPFLDQPENVTDENERVFFLALGEIEISSNNREPGVIAGERAEFFGRGDDGNEGADSRRIKTGEESDPPWRPEEG